MRVPVEWLSEYADPGLPVAQLEERLTMTGTKVEAVHHHGVDALERFVIGRVLEAGRHPDADRLSVCLVDVGDGGPQQIVWARRTSRPGRWWPSRGRPRCMPDGHQARRGQSCAAWSPTG
jgi:phenylalanyl-tRNA synthetase beta chain